MAKALVVDDSRAVRMIISRTLSEAGFDVVQAANGKLALDVIDREGSSIDLAMVDWNMPEMSGIDFVKHLRARPELASLRVVMVTTETETEQMLHALSLGVDEYIMKPFTTEMVVEKLRMIGALA
jgi:two-component system chemotaxis response regulator CheY